mmetsp:Transcript_101054/g.231787  ORF Transcript_101054/g.231787 Transcript_101054/m.231787 type:complete len:396 (-) Transcript_101054:278-1465(-)
MQLHHSRRLRSSQRSTFLLRRLLSRTWRRATFRVKRRKLQRRETGEKSRRMKANRWRTRVILSWSRLEISCTRRTPRETLQSLSRHRRTPGPRELQPDRGRTPALRVSTAAKVPGHSKRRSRRATSRTAIAVRVTATARLQQGLLKRPPQRRTHREQGHQSRPRQRHSMTEMTTVTMTPPARVAHPALRLPAAPRWCGPGRRTRARKPTGRLAAQAIATTIHRRVSRTPPHLSTLLGAIAQGMTLTPPRQPKEIRQAISLRTTRSQMHRAETTMAGTARAVNPRAKEQPGRMRTVIARRTSLRPTKPRQVTVPPIVAMRAVPVKKSRVEAMVLLRLAAVRTIPHQKVSVHGCRCSCTPAPAHDGQACMRLCSSLTARRYLSGLRPHVARKASHGA